MTRLSPLQRQVLEQLAHIRVAPEDAWMTTTRLSQLTGMRSTGPLRTLERTELIRFDLEVRAWRITDKGREALG